MADEIEGSAGPHKPVETDELTEDAFMANLMTQATEQPDAEEEESEEEAEAEEVEETEEAEEETEETEPEAEAIEFLNSLSPEQLREVAQKNKSRLLGDLAKERIENRTLRQQLEEAKEKPANPLETSPSVVHKVIADVPDIAGLRDKLAQAEALEEWAQQILDENGAAGADDVIATHEGKDFTKSEILAKRNFARHIQKKDIPARLKEIQQAEAFAIEEQQSRAAALKIAPEIEDEKSVVGATYKATMEDPVLKEALEKFPALRGKVPFIIALAAQQHATIQNAQPKGKKPEVAAATGETPRPRVPAVPASAGASSGRPQGKQKEVEARKRQFEQSGSSDDFAALLATRM